MIAAGRSVYVVYLVFIESVSVSFWSLIRRRTVPEFSFVCNAGYGWVCLMTLVAIGELVPGWYISPTNNKAVTAVKVKATGISKAESFLGEGSMFTFLWSHFTFSPLFPQINPKIILCPWIFSKWSCFLVPPNPWEALKTLWQHNDVLHKWSITPWGLSDLVSHGYWLIFSF